MCKLFLNPNELHLSICFCCSVNKSGCRHIIHVHAVYVLCLLLSKVTVSAVCCQVIKVAKKLCSNCVLNTCVSLTYPTPPHTPLSPLCLSVCLSLSLFLSCAHVCFLSLSACLGPRLSLLFTAVTSRLLSKQTST